MARSSLLGVDKAPGRAPGHDAEALGPSDTSDSGSDMVGVDELDAADLQLPVDRALDDDRQRPMTPPDTLGADSDAGGTGERRAAAGDAGREAADIGVDQIVGGDPTEPDEPLLEDDIPSDDEEEEEEEDEDEEQDGSGASDRPASSRTAAAPRRGA